LTLEISNYSIPTQYIATFELDVASNVADTAATEARTAEMDLIEGMISVY
jgi:hypothetical protein